MALREYLTEVAKSHSDIVSKEEQENYAKQELHLMLLKHYNSRLANELVNRKEAKPLIELLAKYRASGKFTGLR